MKHQRLDNADSNSPAQRGVGLEHYVESEHPINLAIAAIGIRTGLPEQAYYRPPDPKNIKAAKNGLFVIGLLVWMALPLWLEFLIERGK